MSKVIDDIRADIDMLRREGKYKQQPVLTGPMGPVVTLDDGREVINLCSNNYLGLANEPEVIAGAQAALAQHGFGTGSVRFICGTMSLHLELEKFIAGFFGMEAATTYVSCWNANEALVPTLLGEGDVVISDELNHASIIDACRLCSKKVNRLVYRHNEMANLAECLQQAQTARRKLIIVDGVFSMEGDLANLPEIVKLARANNALVAVDDSHAHGVLGRTGKGTPEHFGVKVDIITGTLGKALGGAAGGFVTAAAPVIDLLVQRSRPQLFSNALPPSVTGGALAAMKLLAQNPQRVTKLQENVAYFRKNLKNLGYEVLDSPSAICPVIIGDTAEAIRIAREMLDLGVLITGFGYPVVPQGTARLRAQISAAHTREQLDVVLGVFRAIRDKYFAKSP